VRNPINVVAQLRSTEQFSVFSTQKLAIQLSNNLNHSIMARTHPIFNFKKSEIKKKQQKTEHLISANGKMDHSVRRESQDGPTFSQTIKSPGQVV
jgi:macrodomain Ter protein organizer (MatP/YcbG family)